MNKKSEVIAMEWNGYKYEFSKGFIVTIYDKFVNMLADEHNGELTKEQCDAAIIVLQRESYDKWFGEIDELCLILHLMKDQGVDKVTVVERGVGLYD